MLKPEIEQFAEVLLREVRDRAIRSCRALLDPEANSVLARRWREKIAGSSPSEAVAYVISDCVDDTIFHLLHAIDSEVLHLLFVTRDGRTADLIEDGIGELGGWYMGSEGWRATYSQEGFVDDFADLNENFTDDPTQEPEDGAD